jgi:predicted AAA+ superfamily ATPase
MADEFRRYTERPELLRQELAGGRAPRQVVIDEVQKVPALLDEVHWLIERRGVAFALCGSSARKVRRGAANLLGGRAIRYELLGLTAAELGDAFDLDRMLNHGCLPRIYMADRAQRLLSAYVADYLRNLPAFSTFLDVAALSDGALVNLSAIARDCGVSSPTVRAYFEILQDTLLGRWLPAYRRRPKRRVLLSPKFYFSDVGVVNQLAHRGRLERRGELYGKAFENWVHHELRAAIAYHDPDIPLGYWRLASGIEVDFVVGDLSLAIEAKATERVTADHLRGLRAIAEDHPRIGRRIVVCLERKRLRTDDGIEVMPVADFVAELATGRLF